MPLAINNNMLGQFSDRLLYLTMLFLLSSPKTLSFSRRSPNLSQKNDYLGLLQRWIVVKFKHQVHNPILRILTVGNFKIMSELIGKPFAL